MIQKAGVEIIKPSAEDLDAVDKASAQVVAEWKKQVGEEVGQRAIDLALGRA
jgi:TRAP-type C4-dicarboxylate transport system substrate-binding protein